jgi:hypothetical protein
MSRLNRVRFVVSTPYRAIKLFVLQQNDIRLQIGGWKAFLEVLGSRERQWKAWYDEERAAALFYPKLRIGRSSG